MAKYCLPSWFTWAIARSGFFHLPLAGEAPDRWQHYERSPSEGTADEFLFELYWIDLHTPTPDLAPGHDAFLVPLRKRADNHGG